MTTIRETTPEDADAVVEILAAADDTALRTPAGWLHGWRAVPQRARRLSLVAEIEGRVVGHGRAGLEWDAVDPTEGFLRSRSLRASGATGSVPRCTSARSSICGRVGATRARSLMRDDGPGPAWAERRCWRPLRTAIVVGVDPRRVEPHPGIAGCRAVPLSSLADRLEEVYELDLLGMRDEPSPVEHGRIPFEEWLTLQWGAPDTNHAGGTAVLEGDRVVALSFLEVDLPRGRAANGFTATHPDCRGRGLATLAKTRSLRWAAEHGVRRVTTGNDETNAPMRAVNRRLGYMPVARLRELELELD